MDQHGIDLSKYPEIQGADILHFHWVNEGIWSEKFIKSLIKLNKPIVWTMHDMWTFTGGCHYDDFCGKYKYGCSMCPVLKSKKEKDEAFHAQQKKSSYLAQLRIQLVGCSNWITEQANESLVGKRLNYKPICIPNPTNAAAFKLYEKELCKQLLEIKTDKKLILFGAVFNKLKVT